MTFSSVLVVAFIMALMMAGETAAYTASVLPRRTSSTNGGLAPAVSPHRTALKDSEVADMDCTMRYKLEQILYLEEEEMSESPSLDDAEQQHGMPWSTSIDPKAFRDDEELLYMPFWNHHLQFLKENLTDLKVMPCSNGKTDFTYNENASKKARIVNLCLTSKEYRKIRLTYYDAGENTQVFNAVMYPDPSYNMPILGVDLLAFNRKKYLAIVDFQPLHATETEHDAEFTHILKPIKESYVNLSGRMSSKFYDETQFFSQQMLFSRFEDESIIQNELFPAFQQYLQTHLNLLRSLPGNANPEFVLQRQKAYDTYSAERDPATGLFTAMFGASWAMDYVHDFLFSFSERPALGTPPAIPSFMGGGGGAARPAAGNHVSPKATSPVVHPNAAPVVDIRRR
jgi:15,16-dihydrobiliverdin:ferredoxin oxidoreductase